MKLYGFQIEYKEEKGIKKFIKKLENYAGIVLALDENKYYLVYEDNEIGRAYILLIYSKYEKESSFRVLDETNVKIVKHIEPLPEEYLLVINKIKQFILAYYKFKNINYIFYKALQRLLIELDDEEKYAIKRIIVESIEDNELANDFIEAIDSKKDLKELLARHQQKILKNVIDIDEFIDLLDKLINVKVYLGKDLKIFVSDTLALTLKAKEVLDFDKKGNKKHFLSYFDTAKILALVTSLSERFNTDEVIELSKEYRDRIEEIIRRKAFEEVAKKKILPFENEKEELALEEFLFNLQVSIPIYKLNKFDEIYDLEFSSLYALVVDDNLIVPSKIFKYIPYSRLLLKFLKKIGVFKNKRRIKLKSGKQIIIYIFNISALSKISEEFESIKKDAEPLEEEKEEELEELEEALQEQKEDESR